MVGSENKPAAEIAEVFSSIQGEGRWVGRRQVFVRFAGCNLSCAYCDTKIKTATEMSADQAANALRSLLEPEHFHHSISLTGGEPLLAGAQFINQFAAAIAGTELPLHLETNGSLPDILREVIDSLTYISMDIKIPSATGEPPQFAINREFLSIASRKECCVKVVFTPKVQRDEIAEAVEVVAGVDPAIPFILQPATAAGSSPVLLSQRRGEQEKVEQASPPALMLSLYDLASSRLRDVRIIPQMHRFLHLR